MLVNRRSRRLKVANSSDLNQVRLVILLPINQSVEHSEERLVKELSRELYLNQSLTKNESLTKLNKMVFFNVALIRNDRLVVFTGD